MAIGTPTKAGSLTGTTQVTNQALTTTASIPSGALILVSVSRQNVNAVSSLTGVTDQVSNTYSKADGNGDGGQNQYTELWYCKNCTALPSGDTVTIQGLNLLSSGPSWGFSVWYVTGMDTSAPLDVHNAGNSNASPWATTAQTTTQAADLLWGVFGCNQNEPAAITNAQSAPTSGWTGADAITYGGNSGNSLRTSYNIVAATGADKAGGTQTAGNAGAFVFAAFKGGGGGTVTGSSTMGDVGGGLASVVSQAEATAQMGMNDVGGLASVVNMPADDVGGSGGLAGVASDALDASQMGMNDTGGLLGLLNTITMGGAGALIVSLPVSVTMGNNDVDGLFPLNDDFELGSQGGGLSIPNAFVGNLNGKWVVVFVKIWRPPGQWNIIPVKMWRTPGQWNTLST